jgi:hypothetical protein
MGCRRSCRIWGHLRMIRRRILLRSVPSSVRILRHVYDCVCGRRDFSRDGTDRAASITGVRRLRGFTLMVITASAVA